MNKLLKPLYIVLGVASVAYYFVLWHASRLGLSMSAMWPVIGVVLIVAGLMCGSPRVPRWLRILWRTGLCVGLVCLMALECLVISGLHAVAPAGMDYLIVLGARVDPDGPSPALTRRLNAVMACLDDHPNAVILASGGQGRNEPISEAQCIRDELVKRGVDPARIQMEDESTDTRENLINCLKLIGDPEARVGIVTNNYHVYRSLLMAEQAGFKNAHGIAAEYTGPTLFHFMIREAVSLTLHFLMGHL